MRSVSLESKVREVAALGFLVAIVLVSFRDAIAGGLVAFEKDTLVSFYPLEVWFAEELKAGRFPLWNPYIFAGYPVFADSEVGLAYPIHLALLWLLPVESAFIWLRISSVLTAAGGMYALGRALRLWRLPSLLGALTFSLGSFFVSQQHHESVVRTAAWLPLGLACTEWALHRAGWRRHAFLTLAGTALGVSALGLHPQVLGMNLLAFATFVVFRVVAGPVEGRAEDARQRAGFSRSFPFISPHASLTTRVALIVWIGSYVGGLGLGLASVQLLPLAELGAATFRGSQPDYFFATSYALPLQNLTNLLFPYFFRGPGGEDWSLWAKWETALYVGITPLILGLLGALVARRREALYFALLAMFSLWLAFATYAPFDLYAVLWQVPGLSAFRAPARYTFLFVLGWSALAALGLQAVADDRRRASSLRTVTTLGLLLAMALGALMLVWGAASLRSGLIADPPGALGWIRETYLSLRHHPGGIEAMDVYRGLAYSLDVANPRTAFGLGLLALSLLLVAGAVVARSTAIWWQIGLVGLASADLVAFGSSVHPKMPVTQLVQDTPPIRLLAYQAPGPWRVYTPGESIPSMEFNRLVPFHLEDIGGYSSVEPRANFVYWTMLHTLQNRLLDIANVRYVVYGAQTPSLPFYRTVPFDPEHPLMLGSRDALGGSESYALGGESGHRLQVISALTRAVEIPQGAVVAEVQVVPVRGEPAIVALRAGVDVAEWAYDRPDVVGKVIHRQPAEIAFRRPDLFPLDGRRYDLYLYYAEQDLPDEMQVERVEIRYVHERGGIEVYGIGLYNFETGRTVGITQQMRSKLRPIYRDAEVWVAENVAAFPRAYVVPRARLTPEGASSLSAMLDTAFDPAHQVMLEGAVGGAAIRGAPATTMGNGPERPLAAEVLESSGDRARFRASAPNGGYFVHVASFYPGWRAWVDGHEMPILLANGLFRAVLLAPGEHVVELRFEPQSVVLGMQMSAWAACAGLAAVSGALLAAWLRQWRSSRSRL